MVIFVDYFFEVYCFVALYIKKIRISFAKVAFYLEFWRLIWNLNPFAGLSKTQTVIIHLSQLAFWSFPRSQL